MNEIATYTPAIVPTIVPEIVPDSLRGHAEWAMRARPEC